MQSILCHFLAIAVLFSSTEGLWEIAKEIQSNSDYYSHQLDADHPIVGDTDTPVDDCIDQCENICFSHFSILPKNNEITWLASINDPLVFTTNHFSFTPQAPPTPPPNA